MQYLTCYKEQEKLEAGLYCFKLNKFHSKCERMKESGEDHWEDHSALPDAIPNPHSITETNDKFYRMEIKIV